ncbi:MAG TPA: hypothetical protein VNH64_10535 [Parvularculaceae bacterium]|nr:hypothetical protein [Parvularculaceae bacterium]
MPFGRKGVSTLTNMPEPRERAADRPSVDPATVAEITAWPKHGGEAEAPASFTLTRSQTNLAAALIARGVIIFAAIFFLLRGFFASGDINQWLAFAIFAMIGDLLRVVRKTIRRSEP